MVETWRARFRRELAEIDAGVRSTLTRDLDDKQLRDELEALARKPHFATQTWRWGPVLYKRNRVLFRPFILSNFGSDTWDVNGRVIDAWKGDGGPALEGWLDAVDKADDIELTRRLYGWQLQSTPWKQREARWCTDIVRRFETAATPSARFAALAKLDIGYWLDVTTATALYRLDRATSRKFILAHMPWFGSWSRAKPRDWVSLLELTRDDPEFHFELYRRIVEPKQWRTDVVDLCKRVRDAGELDRELERRHPRAAVETMAEAFVDLVRARGLDVVPYVMRHVRSVSPRWFFGQRQGKGLDELLALARDRGWWELWGALLRTSSTQQVFDREVKRLVDAKQSDDEVRARLAQIAGQGAEANFPGISFAVVKPLQDETAVALYRRFPELVRGPYRMHCTTNIKLVTAALEAGDAELVDYFASRVGMQVVHRFTEGTWKDINERLTAHYESLPDGEFVARAANALSRMPAFAVWNYDALLRANALARLLFERSTPLFLGDANAVRDLLESPQIHVQMLAFRILGGPDPRAAAIGAANVDLLQAALFRPLHTRTRLFAMRAIERAAGHDEDTARYLLGRMREALALPEKRYPTEKLIGLIGKVLYRWPTLRAPTEVPRIYGEVRA